MRVEARVRVPNYCVRDNFPGRSRQSLERRWSIASGQWSIGPPDDPFDSTGGLRTGPTREESWIWAGSPPRAAPEAAVYEVVYRTWTAEDSSVGRHGGIMFCATAPTNRLDPMASGYTLDYIDREDDRGLRLFRVDHGVLVPLHVGTPEVADLPLSWRVEVAGGRIRCFADGNLLIEVFDGTYQGGFFGLWAWERQEVTIDDVTFGCEAPLQPDGGLRLPGDCNSDGSLNLSDAVCLLNYLFQGTVPRLPCGDGSRTHPGNLRLLDSNGDQRIDLSDPIRVLGYLFLGLPPPVSGKHCIRIAECPETCKL